MEPLLPTSQPTSPANVPTQTIHRRSRIVIILTVIVVIATLACVWYVFSTQGPACLTRADYKTLSGEVLPDEAPLTPSVDFYGFDITFTDGNVTYADPTISAQLYTIGEFARTHPDTSLNITLGVVYRDTDMTITSNLIHQRLNSVTNSLTNAGVKPSAIKTDIKTYTPDAYDDSLGDDGSISLAITSIDTCRR